MKRHMSTTTGCLYIQKKDRAASAWWGWGGNAEPVQRLQAARGRLQFNIKKALSTPIAVWKRNSQKVGAPYSQL